MYDRPQPDREVMDRLHRRASAAITGFSAAVPAYPQTAAEMVEDDFVAGVRRNVDLVIRTIASGAQPTDVELEPIVALAVQRNVDGVPVDDLVAAYQAGADVIWSALIESATSAEKAVLLDAVPASTRYLMTVTARIVAACPTVGRVGRDEDQRAVAEAILAGREPEASAAVAVGSSYRVVVVSSDGGVDLRDVELRLRAVAGALVIAHPIGLVALIPADGADPVPVLDAARDSEGRSLPPVAGVSEPIDTPEVPAAFSQARLICRLSRLFGRGTAVIDDVMFPYLVATQTDSHPRLRAVADAVRSAPQLADTLAAFERCSSNQLAAARELGVHRNTVTYRLGRIATLTGHDPLTVDGARVLAAAMIVSALDDDCANSSASTR